MSVPPRTKLWMNIVCCTNVKKISASSIPGGGVSHAAAEEEVANARDALRQAYLDAGSGTVDVIVAKREVKRKEKSLDEAMALLESIPEEGDVNASLLPNPFVVVTVDEDDKDSRPMVFTQVKRGTVDPIWKEELKEYPFEMHITGKRALEIYENGAENYHPRALMFSIYHDDGLPDKGRELFWKRHSPRRSLLLGRGMWDFMDICRKVNCPEFEKEIDVFDPMTGRKIKDAVLTLKVKLCAPKIRHCRKRKQTVCC